MSRTLLAAPRTLARTLAVSLLAALSLGGCAVDASEAEGGEDVSTGQAEQGAHVARAGARWLELSPTRQIPVCWVVPQVLSDDVDFEVKAAVRAAVEREYNGRTSARFVGFTDCTAADGDLNVVRARFETARTTPASHPGGLSWVGPSVRTLPNEVGTSTATMWFGAPRVWSSASPWLQRATLRAALHEFGHALGLQHEQDRADAPDCPRDDDQVRGKDVASVGVGAYDAQSIMNYCRTDEEPRLTDSDVNGVSFLFSVHWPSFSSFRALPLRAGQPFAEVSILGSGFDETTQVMVDGMRLATRVDSANKVTTTLGSNLLAVPGARKLRLVNLAPTGEILDSGVTGDLVVAPR